MLLESCRIFLVMLKSWPATILVSVEEVQHPEVAAVLQVVSDQRPSHGGALRPDGPESRRKEAKT